MPKKTKTTITNLEKNTQAIRDGLPKKGTVLAFEPDNSRLLQAKINDGFPIEKGAFRRGILFDLDESDAQVEKDRRYSLPRAEFIMGLLGKITAKSGNDEKNIVVKLLELEIYAEYNQATMIEAARQWVTECDAGTLTEERSEWLKELLNKAQDRIYKPLRNDIAEMALEKIGGVTSQREILSQEARQAWGKYLHEKYDAAFDTIFDQFADDEPINGRKLAEMTVAFMETIGLEMAEPSIIDAKDDNPDGLWTVIYDKSLSSFNVIATSKTVRSGDRKKPLDRLGFEKLMIHEVLVHVLRAENGARTGHRAFQKGLPGYSAAEEGTGLLMEALWSGENPDELGRDHFRYAAVAFASGVYDGVLHDEQETYEFTKALMDKAGLDDPDELYRHVMRAFRGMPDGCRMRSNASYLDGKISMMQYLQERFDSGETVEGTFKFLQGAKIDPTNLEHTSLYESKIATKSKA